MRLALLQVAPGGVELRPRKSYELRGSPEPQNGGLGALEEAWDDFLIEAVSCQVCLFSVLLGRVCWLVCVLAWLFLSSCT